MKRKCTCDKSDNRIDICCNYIGIASALLIVVAELMKIF